MVTTNPTLKKLGDQMFSESAKEEPLLSQSPTYKSLDSFDEFIVVLNEIVSSIGPEFYLCQSDASIALNPCGLVGVPINAVLAWPMNTEAGMNFFSHQLVNMQLKKVLNYWAVSFLNQPDSTYVLNASFNNSASLSQGEDLYPSLGWLSEPAQNELVQIVNNASGVVNAPDTFEEIFVCDPTHPTYGYESWDQFFVRLFREGVRPVEDADNENVIVNACESAPLQVQTNVKLTDTFWLKGQPYSILDMLNYHELSQTYVDGTAYQVFLSALSYHRWHSPIDGTIVDAFLVDGSYYFTNQYTGFGYEVGPDANPQVLSEPMLSAVAARAVIFIESDNPAIGTLAFVGIGMGEVSTNDITVSIGDKVKKGDQIGMFHFGGSTHVLLFQKDVQLEFIDRVKATDGVPISEVDSTNIALSSKIATVVA